MYICIHRFSERGSKAIMALRQFVLENDLNLICTINYFVEAINPVKKALKLIEVLVITKYSSYNEKLIFPRSIT